MVRCVLLLSVSDRQYRERLIHDSVMAKPWRNQWTANARSRCQLHHRPKLRGLTTRAQDSILPHTLDATKSHSLSWTWSISGCPLLAERAKPA
jgi:hypothetical protein